MTEAATPAAPAIDAASTLAGLGLSIPDASSANEVQGGDEVSEASSGNGGETDAGATGDGKGDQQADAAEATAVDDAATGKDAAAVKPQDAKRAAFEALFTDEALATPEGVKAAKAAIREAKVKHHEVWQRTVTRERTAKQEAAAARQAQETYNRFTGQLTNTLQLLQQGTPEQALHALGVLRGKAGIDAYEELTSTVIGIKKQPTDADSPKVQKLAQELEALKSGIQAQQQKAENDQWRSSVAQTAAAMQGDKPAFPAIVHFVKEGKATLRDVVQAVEEDFVQNGVAPAESLSRLNKIWMAHVPSAPAPATGIKKLAGGALPGRGVSPSKAGGAAGHRELSEEEALKEMSQDPALLKALGL